MIEVIDAPNETLPTMSGHVTAYVKALPKEQRAFAVAYWKFAAGVGPQPVADPEFKPLAEYVRITIADRVNVLYEQDADRAAGAVPTNSLADEPAGQDAPENEPTDSKVGSTDVPDIDRLRWYDEWSARLSKQLQTLHKAESEEDECAEALKSAKKYREREQDVLNAIVEEKQQPMLPFSEPATMGETPVLAEPLKWMEDAEGRAWSAANSVYEDIDGNYFRFVVKRFDEGGAGYYVGDSPSALLPDKIPTEFETLDDAQAWCQSQDDENSAIRDEDSPPANDEAADPLDESWRSVTLEGLGITKPRIVKALTEREPSLSTLGAIADHSAKHGDFWAVAIKGVGKAAAQEVTDAIDAYWTAHPRAK